MDNKAIVWSEIETVSQEQKKTLAPLSDELPLLESGLDSLCLAIIVARLEEKLGIDPFMTPDQAAFPITLGDLTRLYSDAR